MDKLASEYLDINVLDSSSSILGNDRYRSLKMLMMGIFDGQYKMVRVAI